MTSRVTALLELGSAEIVAGLAALSPRELTEFDWRSRHWAGGLLPKTIDGAAALGLVAADGHRRERAIRTVELTPLTVRLLALRAVDWVDPVRAAALERLATAPAELLVAALPQADRLARRRARGTELEGLLDRRLSDAELLRAAWSADPLIHRSAWRRLRVITPALAEQAARDRDVVVRAVAASALESLPDAARRRVAALLVEDHLGWIVRPALAVLVACDGEAAIRGGLTGRSRALRWAARDQARLHGIDARAVYLEAGDTLSLCEVGDRRDTEVFRAALGDRARVCAPPPSGYSAARWRWTPSSTIRRAASSEPPPRPSGPAVAATARWRGWNASRSIPTSPKPSAIGRRRSCGRPAGRTSRCCWRPGATSPPGAPATSAAGRRRRCGSGSSRG